MQSSSILITGRPRSLPGLLALVLVLTTLAAFWPATHGGFVNYDDGAHVTANTQVQKGLTWESLKWACYNPVNCNWHPVTLWSHMADCQLFGLKAWGHHFTSILLHALNAGLVFGLLLRMTGAVWRSLVVAALFALHPLRVESVAWVSERKDVLSGFFGLLSLLAYARYASGARRSGVRGQTSAVRGLGSPPYLPSSIFYLLSIFFYALGLLSKPMLVTWPFVMLLLDYWPLGRIQTPGSRIQNPEPSTTQSPILWRLVWEKVPFFALAAGASIVTYLVQNQAGAVMGADSLSFGARAENALISYGRYLGKLVWPTELAVYYPHPGHWPLGVVALAGVTIMGLSVLAWLGRRRHPYFLMGWLWFVGMLVPVIGLVQMGAQAMADRYTYLPSLGALILAVWGIYNLARIWRYQAWAWWAAGSVAVVVCLALTRAQIRYWTDSEALFRHALEVTENNSLAHYGLGVALDGKGRIGEAIQQLQQAIRLNPDNANAQYNLGVAFFQQGRSAEAIRQFRETVRLRPNHAEAHNNLGTALGLKGQTDEAIQEFQAALRLKPDYAEARKNLAILLATKGHRSPPE